MSAKFINCLRENKKIGFAKFPQSNQQRNNLTIPPQQFMTDILHFTYIRDVITYFLIN